MNNIHFKFDKRFVAGLLAVIALLTSLFFDCVSLGGEAKRELRSAAGGYEYQRLVEQFLVGVDLDSLNTMSALDPTGNTGKLIKVVKRVTGCLKSGGISLMEVRTMLSMAAKSAKLVYEDSSGLVAGKWMYTLFLLIVIGSFALAMSGVVMRRRARGFWFASMLLVLLFIELGVMAASEGLFVITLWPIIGLGCAIASIVLCFQAARPAYGPAYAPGGYAPNQGSGIDGAAIANGLANVLNAGKQMGQRVGRVAASAAASASAAAKAATSWTCPSCGRQVDMSGRFCPGCGTPRPEKPKCPQCGAEIREGSAFCSRCGCNLSGAQAQARFHSNAQAGYNPNPQNGYNPNVRNGYNPNPQPGYNPNPQAGYNPNPQPGYNANPQNGFNPSPRPQAGFDGMNLDATVRENIPSGTLRTEEPATPPLPVTIIVDQADTHQEYALSLNDSLTIGRGPICTVRVEDGTVSGTHLRIEREGDSVFATDLQSANGTKLNGEPLLSRTALTSGDVLTLGRTQVTINF